MCTAVWRLNPIANATFCASSKYCTKAEKKMVGQICRRKKQETSNSDSGDGWVLVPFIPDSKRSDRALERL